MRNNIFFDRIRSNPAQLFFSHGENNKTLPIRESHEGLPEVLVITSYPPRECGIATYTQDLKKALDKQFGNAFAVKICALEAGISNFNYPEEVKYVLNSEEARSYYDIADRVNNDRRVSLVLIQHEFGLYQEEALFQFMSRLTKPVITVFHTVLPRPDDSMKSKVRKIVMLSDSVVVMTNESQRILTEEYQVDAGQINVIAHGTHQAPSQDKEALKQKYDLTGRKVLSTFGLLSSGKGIETTLDAMPSIVKTNPETIFLVIGKTHPGVVKSEGEKYREMLQKKVKDLDIQNNVRFINRYLSLEDLLEYLQLTDIYLFTSRDPNQAVSGTFSYAMSCGCPIISTPIPHAKEVLSEDTGMFIDFQNSGQLAQCVTLFLNDEELLHNCSINALQKMAPTSWENSAVAHASLFEKNAAGHLSLQYNLPPLNLNHIKNMTTGIGMFQFSKINVPDPDSGYTLDDNARALIAVCMHYEQTGDEQDIPLMETYLQFIRMCIQPAGYFLNYVDADGEFTAQNNSTNLADASGRAIWALGYFMHSHATLPVEMKLTAEVLFHRAVSRLHQVHSTRAMAFAIKGLYYFNLSAKRVEYRGMITMLASRMADMYDHESDGKWNWFEGYLTYANGVLPEAMLLAYLETNEPRYKLIAHKSFEFLLSHIFTDDGIRVISNRSWLHKNQQSDIYGEQPIDVAYTILALAHFYDVFGDNEYLNKMEIAFNWFLGKNHLKHVIYNASTGGCYDGLEELQVNLNQGAESVLSYLLARLTTEKYMHKAEKKQFNRIRESKRRLEVYLNYGQQNQWS